MIVGGLIIALGFLALIGLTLCAAARVGDDLAKHAHRDEYIASVPVYSTRDRGADPRVVREMHTGTLADDAVAKVYGGTR